MFHRNRSNFSQRPNQILAMHPKYPNKPISSIISTSFYHRWNNCYLMKHKVSFFIIILCLFIFAYFLISGHMIKHGIKRIKNGETLLWIGRAYEFYPLLIILLGTLIFNHILLGKSAFPLLSQFVFLFAQTCVSC